MSRKFVLLTGVLGMLLVLSGRVFGETPQAPEAEATITSDELELIGNGARSIFHGHVILKQDPYLLLADRMVRTKATGIVDAYGHIRGTWISERGEKVYVTAKEGRYLPAQKMIQLWGQDRVKIRREDAKGTAEFVGDRGWIFLDVKKARLIDSVRGHVIPL